MGRRSMSTTPLAHITKMAPSVWKAAIQAGTRSPLSSYAELRPSRLRSMPGSCAPQRPAPSSRHVTPYMSRTFASMVHRLVLEPPLAPRL
jgi:hypothetical protein